MSDTLKWGRGTFCLAILLTSAAAAQNPTFSLEVLAVNSIPPVGGPTSRIAVAPGDELTVKLFVRDWSPDGEALRSYQGVLDTVGFTSGYAGSIKPIDYDAKQEKKEANEAVFFVDRSDPQFVYGSREVIALADTISPDHRWLGVLLDSGEAIVSEQDGTKFYCGTVRLRVSEDANGPFTLGIIETPGISGLRTPLSRAIIPLDFEKLEVIVSEKARVLRIVSSNPPNGSIDARRPSKSRGGSRRGWNRLELTFSGDTAGISAADCGIDDGSKQPPKIKAIIPNGSTAELVLDRGVRPGVWTTVIHKPSRTSVRVGYLPGDVDNDGFSDADDILALLQPTTDDATLPRFRSDIDYDGAVRIADALRIVDLLTEPDACRLTLNVP